MPPILRTVLTEGADLCVRTVKVTIAVVLLTVSLVPIVIYLTRVMRTDEP